LGERVTKEVALMYATQNALTIIGTGNIEDVKA